MAFRLREGKPVLGGDLARLAREQLGEGRRALGPARSARDERIHQLRLALKRTRALLRLWGTGPGGRRRKEVRQADAALRRLARRVGALRDAAVLVATYDGVVAAARPNSKGAGEADEGAWVALRRRLRRRLDRRQSALAGGALERRWAARLQRAEAELPSPPPEEDAAQAVWRGFVAGYRRARRAMREAYDRGGGEAFHAWRRAVKTHRYHVQLLRDIGPRRLTASRLEELDRLDDCLGREHDLTVLEELLAAHPGWFPHVQVREALLAAIEAARRQLREEARPLGAHLFAERPGDLGPPPHLAPSR